MKKNLKIFKFIFFIIFFLLIFFKILTKKKIGVICLNHGQNIGNCLIDYAMFTKLNNILNVEL